MTDGTLLPPEQEGRKTREERPGRAPHASKPGRSNLRRLVKLGLVDPQEALDLEADYYTELDNEGEDDGI